MEKDFVGLLLDCGVCKKGSYLLSSGVKSDYYIDVKGALASNADLLAMAAGMMSEHVVAGKIAGAGFGAAPLAAAVSMLKRVPYVLLRTEGKGHGLGSGPIGTVDAGETIDIIEDVVTSGGTVLRTAEQLKALGAVINRAICIVDREAGGGPLLAANGILLIPLLKASSLLRAEP